MDPKPELKMELSMLLNAELAKQLLPGEGVRISLPGSFGEAFVVTDKRAIVVRECDSGPGCQTHAHALADVSGATAAASGTGGYVEMQLSQPPAVPDEARVYFPTYDLEKFKQAAEFISALVAASAAVADRPASAVVGGVSDPDAPACPQCGAKNEEEAAFCGQCGAQLRTICSECGVSSPPGAKFCRFCGRAMEEFVPTCQKCGARVMRGLTFCTECGGLLRQSCANCGMNVLDTWKYCPTCGRQLGSGYVNPRTAVARRIQSRLNETEETASQSSSVIAGLGAAPPQVESVPSAAGPSSVAAEQHNQRGRELFDSEDTEGAIREFQLAVEADPGNASYHCNLAVAYDENEQDAEALAEYENTLRLDPNDVTALLSLGYMHNENEESDKAREFWNRVIEIDPDTAEGQEARANLDNLGQL